MYSSITRAEVSQFGGLGFHFIPARPACAGSRESAAALDLHQAQRQERTISMLSVAHSLGLARPPQPRRA